MRFFYCLLLLFCMTSGLGAQSIKVILDTDANNELDDQHAIAYMLFNQHYFDILGITTNATYNGGELEKHTEEANRVVALCGYTDQIQVIPGASATYKETVKTLDQAEHDGHLAVDFIIEQARKMEQGRLVVVPVGTLTNVALAVAKAPDIAAKIRVVWLGSNWPDAGEYNLVNDTTAINSLIDNRKLELEICTVRYGEPTGTAAVLVSVERIKEVMKGLGPQIDTPVSGRHGGSFSNFGDYSINLFEKIGDAERSLFDVCALAVIKNPKWGKPSKVPAPKLMGDSWIERPKNNHHIIFWEHFNSEAILNDFYQSVRNAGSP